MNDARRAQGRLLPTLGVVLVGLLAGYFSQSMAVWAHDARPVFVEVQQVTAEDILLAWKTPETVAPANVPDVVLLAPCVLASAPDALPAAETFERRRRYRCTDPQTLRLRFHYEQGNPSLSTMVRYQAAGRAASITYLPPEADEVLLRANPGAFDTFVQYGRLGVQHILAGYDHLLFVACLVLLALRVVNILWAVTGFTVAHSLTLAAAAMGWVAVPQLPVEACIALSIVFLATELVRDAPDTLTRRHPGAIAFLFGLLHGFGFAGVLNEIGIPETELVSALFGFNVGVEVGQLAFVAAVLLGLRFAARVVPLERGRRYAAYPIGLLASFWLWERLSQFGW